MNDATYHRLLFRFLFLLIAPFAWRLVCGRDRCGQSWQWDGRAARYDLLGQMPGICSDMVDFNLANFWIGGQLNSCWIDLALFALFRHRHTVQ